MKLVLLSGAVARASCAPSRVLNLGKKGVGRTGKTTRFLPSRPCSLRMRHPSGATRWYSDQPDRPLISRPSRRERFEAETGRTSDRQDLNSLDRQIEGRKLAP